MSSDSIAPECHMLPCSIAYDGKVASHVYFRPTRWTDENDSNTTTTTTTVYAATLRGRGLLGHRHEQLQGYVIAVQGTQVVSQFSTLYEWQHTHQPSALHQSRMSNAVEWIQVAQALHQPLPIEDN